MRIVLIVPAFPKLSETFIASKFAGLLELGCDVHVLCSKSEAVEWLHFQELKQRSEIRKRVHTVWPHRPFWIGVFLLPLSLVRCWLLHPYRTWLYLSRGIRCFGLKIFRRFYLDAELILLTPDIVHFEFGALAAERMYLKHLLDCKIIVSFRGYDLNYVGLESQDYYQEVWDGADAIHVLGDDLWHRAQRRGCPARTRHALIPPAIDTDFFDPIDRQHTEVAGTKERPLRIVAVGRLEWKKGYEYSLEAIAELAKSNIYCEFRIIGDGSYLEPLAFARYQLGLEKNVHFLGAQPRTSVKREMLWADVMLHAAVSEGFCNGVIEAQAMCLPVVCTDADGLRENVADNSTGFIATRRNPQALAAKLALLAHDEELRQRMGTAGRQRVLKNFLLKDRVSEFEMLYRSILETPDKVKGNMASEIPLPMK